MAVEKYRRPSWFSRWFTSSKGIVASLFGIGALGLHLWLNLGIFWPFVVAGSYLIGALVAPKDRLELRLQAGKEIAAEDLMLQLDKIRDNAKDRRRQLGDQNYAKLQGILATLNEVVNRWSELSVAPQHRLTAENIIIDYLPASVESYLNLPGGFVYGTPRGERRTAAEDFAEQLELLESESTRIRDAVYENDVRALGDHSRFLKEKFGQSELDL